MARASKATQASEKAGSGAALELAFEFIKGNYFRVIHVDGAWGGMAPSGRNIHMALFNERRPIPTEVVHPISAAGALGPEIGAKRRSRTGMVREVEVELVMALETAISIHTWLGEKIVELAKVQGISIEAKKMEVK
jgi:hypothetical protein